MRRILAGSVFLTLATLLVCAAPGTARATVGTAQAPPGEVRVQGQAFEGQFDTFRGTLRVTCRPGLRVTSLGLTFVQDFTSPEAPQTARPVCDGAWHVVTFSSYEGFHPGRATVRARLALASTPPAHPSAR